MANDFVDKIKSVFKDLPVKCYGIGLIDRSDRFVSGEAVGSYTKDPLRDDDAPAAAAPEPVDQDLGHRLAFDGIGAPAVPVEIAKDDGYILAGEESKVMFIDIAVAVLVVPGPVPGGEGNAHVGRTSVIGRVGGEASFEKENLV